VPDCDTCTREDMSKAQLLFTQQESLLCDSHEGASLWPCHACGRLFVHVWREVGGWEIEDIWRYWAPVAPAEVDALRAAFARDGDDGMARATALLLSRRHLVESPTHAVYWSASDHEIGLWMHT
jgi:hypothetical protein